MTCDWPVDRSCLPALPAEDDPEYGSAAAARQAAENLAVQVLWGLSGRQFGICGYIVRPCLALTPDQHRRPGTPALTAYVVSWEGDHWENLPCGCSGMCRTAGPRAVHLPGPARDIIAVTVAGVILPDDQYVLEGDILHRVGRSWPRQNLSRPMGEPDTWSVEYLRGNPVPPGVDRLTGLLAKEFLAACGGGTCRLPRTVTSVTRQGISYQVFNPNDIYESGKTGLTEVDMWLAAVNPHRLLAAPAVL